MTRPLKALSVGNFKAFAETQRIPLKPITLIFGPNSAGKSSFLHSLVLAHEAQFSRGKRSLSRLDVHHTEIGGTAIDLGGFRQYVHRGQLNKRVEWGAELQVSRLSGRLAQLLTPVKTVTLNLALGIELDNEDRPKPGAEPRVEAVEILGDGTELLRMSHRRSDTQEGLLRLDRLANEHPVFRQILKAIVESSTTSEEMRPEDFDGAAATIADLLPQLQVRMRSLFPEGVALPQANEGELSPAELLFPVSKGNRREDLANAIRFYLPRTLNDLLKGMADALATELEKFQYLGPLRSFPSRHFAFADHEDSNWYAGGGYAWDVVRRDEAVRNAVNGWLGAKNLKTPYELRVRSFVALDEMIEPLEQGLDEVYKAAIQAGIDSVSKLPEEMLARGDYNVYETFETLDEIGAQTDQLVDTVESSSAKRIQELVLVDQRTGTVVTHRDVGIGISQVLPVLVAAYGAEGKLLGMEQPEIHLHPALQAELGDVFIESALGDQQNTFILETHSEHLMLRLLRRIRETTDEELPEGIRPLTPDDICVVYIKPERTGSEAVALEVTPDGDFADHWPEGFFAERAKELF